MTAGGVSFITSLAGCSDSVEDNGGEINSIYDSPSLLTNNLDTRPMVGEESAANAIISIDDPSCPFCATFRKEVYPDLYTELIDTGKVRYYSTLIDTISDWSVNAVRYLQALHTYTESDDDYFKLLEYYYSNQSELSTLNVRSESNEFIKNELNLDSETIENLSDGDETIEEVDNMIENIQDSGINSTPTFAVFRNNQLVTEISGIQDVETFRRLID